ncbi:MAG TPA: ABC transporter permease [Gemmatimonadales bacterium]
MSWQARRRRLARGLWWSAQLLAAHRLRTVLSISGLLVGVAALMVMVAVGAGAERRVLERVRAMGINVLVVNAATAPRVAGRPRQVSTLTVLRPADAEAIAEGSALVAAAAPMVNQALVASWSGRNARVTVTGTTATGLRIRDVQAAAGRLFDDADDRERRRVALLGRSVAQNLFGPSPPVGQQIRIGSVPFEVIGVMRPRGTDVGGTDLDNVIFLPLETAMRRVLNIPYVHALFVQARSSADLEALDAEVREILLDRYGLRTGLPVPFVIQNQAVLLRTERGAARAMRRLTAGIAVMALVVGGGGIVALMLLSLRERTREIGLRRAVGARRRDIKAQFLLEAAVLSTAGGTAGVVAGVLIAALASLLGPWDLVISWPAAGLGIVCSGVLGLIVGTAPAARAARLEPIQALHGD